MTSNAPFNFDVLVVGAGPAGMAAAARAAESGARTGLVDENFRAGGQIWRSGCEDVPAEAKFWIQRCTSAGVMALRGVRVVDQLKPGELTAESMDGTHKLGYQQLVIATGARERFLPFPGWTLLNVMGAGGLQAMVKSGLPIQGKRVLVAGTGPLLLAVASYLKLHGAQIVLICEQASWSALAAFGLRLIGFRQKIKEALELKGKIAGIPFAANTWPVAALGSSKLESVT